MERYRIHAEAAVYYLTYSVVEWLPVFVSQASCKIVTDSLAFCHRAKHLRINAYVIMPTHMHLIVFDADLDSERLVRTLADFRGRGGTVGRPCHDAPQRAKHLDAPAVSPERPR